MRIYLCGPMTPKVAPNLNRAAFREATQRLESLGHTVFNPGTNPDELTYEQCMRLDINEVLRADAVAVLPRWIEGVGTRVEVAVALAIGTPVYTYTVDGLLELYAAQAGRPALAGLLDGTA